MKTSKFFKTGLLLFAVGLGLMGCGDDDKEPEIVIDPVGTNVEYYIDGKVTADNAPLSGVSVTAGEATATTDDNGQYSLTVKEKKVYTVSFVKEGYKTISDATVEIENDAANRSLRGLNVIMTQEGVAVNVGPEDETVITEKGEGEVEGAMTAIIIPAGAVSTATDISITPYVETGSGYEAPGDKEEALALLNVVVISSQDATLNKDIELSVANPGNSGDYYFDHVELHEKSAARAAGEWIKYADAAFNRSTGRYESVVKEGSRLDKEYSLRVKSEKHVSAAKNDEVLQEDTYSNAGNLDAAAVDILYTAKLGWELSASGADNNMLALIRPVIAAQEGGMEGIYTVNKTFTAQVSGDYVLYYSCKAKYIEKEYTFSVCGQKVTVKVKHYLGMDFVYTNQSSSMHSGGSMGGK